jgi:hypothetical protein
MNNHGELFRLREEKYLATVLVIALITLFILLISVQETIGEADSILVSNIIVYDLSEQYPNSSSNPLKVEGISRTSFPSYLPLVYKDLSGSGLGLGEACAFNSQCLSGYCNPEDQVCCDTDCTGICESCLASKTGGINGVCGNVLDGTDPENECHPYYCSSGSCGTSCIDNAQCQPAFYCEGGV